MKGVEFDLSVAKCLIGEDIAKIFRTSDFLFKDEYSQPICDINYKLTIKTSDAKFYSFELVTLSRYTSLLFIPNDLHHTEHTTNKEFTYESIYPLWQKGVFEVDLIENEYLKTITSLGYIKDKNDIAVGFYIEIADYDKFYILFSETKINLTTILTDWQISLQKTISNVYTLEKQYF